VDCGGFLVAGVRWAARNKLVFRYRMLIARTERTTPGALD
jgi:hypothetical protein